MFHVVSIDNLPRPVRHKRSQLEHTQEWAEMQKRLQKGLKPYEAAVTVFSPDQLTQLNIKTAAKVFLDLTKEYIDTHKMKLDVWKYKAEDGSQVIVAADRVILEKRSAVIPMTLGRRPGRPRKAA